MNRKKRRIITALVFIAFGFSLFTYNIIETNSNNKFDLNIEVKHESQYVIEYGEEFNFDTIRLLYVDTLYED